MMKAERVGRCADVGAGGVRRVIGAAWLACAACAGGCLRFAAAPPATLPSTMPAAATVAPAAPVRTARPADPAPFAQPVASLLVRQFGVPWGTASANDAFWKRVDEQILDISIHDLLQKNGLRLGSAAVADYEHLRAMLERGPARARPEVFVAPGVKTVNLPMKQGVGEQTVYFFDRRNEFSLRSHDDSDNIMVLEFGLSPRLADHVRVGLMPMIRSLRRRLVAAGDVHVREIEVRQDERYFDLGVRIDVPLDRMLILAPSPEAANSMSLGHAMLVHDGDTAKIETVIIIVPQVMKARR